MAYRIILKSQKTNARANEYRYLTQKMRSRIDEMTVNGKSVYDIADTVAKEFNMDTPSAERIVSDYFDPSKKKRANDGPKEYTCQFWEPGLVSYEDSGAGKALLRKESMDKILPSFVGKPVTIDHVEGSPDEIMNAGRAVGKVTNAYWNPDTGWYECKFTVENEDARKKVESGWSVSCAFDVSEQTGPGGEHHAIPYDEEITSGTFTHLALVENPRYEDSKIFRNHKMRLNSKGVKMNGNFVKIKPPNRNFGETVAQVISESGDQLMVKVLKGWLGDDAGEFTIKKSDIIRWTDQHGNSKDNAKTVLISIPYRLLERDDYKNPDQELQAKGMRNVGGGGGVADFEFNGTESQAAAIVKQVLGTVSGVDIGMLNSKGAKAVVKENEKVITQGKIAKIVEKDGRFYIYSLAGKLLVYNDDLGMAKSNFEAIESGDTSFNAKQNDTAGDFGTVIHRELRGLKNAVDTKAAVAYIEAELRRDETISESAMIAKVQAHFPINEEAAEDLVGEAMGFKGKHKYTPRKNGAGEKYEREIEALQDQLRTETMSPAEAVKIANQIKKLRRELDEYAASKKNDSTSDFGTILREIKEQLYQMAQALGSKFSGKENAGAEFQPGDRVAATENVGAIKSGTVGHVDQVRGDTVYVTWEQGGRYAVRSAEIELVSRVNENSQKFKVTKKHLTGPLAGMTTDEITSVEFKVGEKIKSVEGTEYVVESVQRQNSGEPYSVSIEHRPEERGGDVYRVALIKDGKEADHILVKGDAAAQDQKRKWLQQYNQKQNSAGDQFQVGDNVKRAVGAIPGDPSGKIVEKRELTCKVKWDGATSLQEVQYYTDLQKAGAKNSRVILKPGKSNSTQEKKPMFGLFKRKSKKNDQAAAPAKLPLEQIDVEIDGVAVPLPELVTGYKAEQAEIAEKAKLDQAQAAKEVSEAPEAPAPEANADNTAPEDLNLDNQEFSIEDGSRFNMTELVDSYNRRKAAKCNAEKETKENSYGNYMIDADLKKGMSPDDVVKRIMARYSDIKEPQARSIVEAVQKGGPDAQADWSKNNAQETDEEKAAREKKEADDKAAKENAKKDPKYFHKLNDLKNAGEVITGKAIETLSDKIERGNARYGSKKK